MAHSASARRTQVLPGILRPPTIAPMKNLDRVGDQILERLQNKNERRELVLGRSRQVVQHAARAIRAVHRREWDEAAAIAAEARTLLGAMHEAAAGHPDLQSAGYMLDAQKEYAEACLTLALVRGDDLPAPDALGVDDAAWLNGLGEAGGELRRAALDMIRRDEIDAAETVLERMQEIHTLLSTIDYPAAITRNLKRTNDMVRGVTERTRGDLTLASRQERLKAAIEGFEAKVDGSR